MSRWTALWVPKSAILHSSLGPFASNDSSLSPHKIIFKGTFFTLYSGALTLLKLNYLHLLIIINYLRFITCVIVNQLTLLYRLLFLAVKGTPDGTTDFDCPSFQFRRKSQTCFFNFYFLALKWLICIWCQMPNILNYSFLK